MSGVHELVEIKFRLHDGSDIGPNTYSIATSIATLKERILAQWPKEKKNGPRTINDLKLINAGKILENNRTLAECKSPICDFSGMTTMHVVVRAPSAERGTEKRAAKEPKEIKCGCVIL
ncbi:membrane-anchored ubiquitin-fold protein 1-like [Typha latifolia]|uniref:membrane-anchored ubiquitin-fold protein 1-like n=1 Tax=Typha latifolia TaxID=4733 RepID=UPI003C301917